MRGYNNLGRKHLIQGTAALQTLGVGIVGHGFMGKVHAYGYRILRIYYEHAPLPTRLVGVADAAPERAPLAVEQAGLEFSATDWRELGERDDIHIIGICSPNSLHTNQLLAAVEAGKHVYCDKPLVAGEESTARVEAALGQSGHETENGRARLDANGCILSTAGWPTS